MMKFIKLSGRPRKNIVISHSQMAFAHVFGCAKVGGYLAIHNIDMALNVIKEPCIIKKLMEMKNG
jgi:hypothetical protein